MSLFNYYEFANMIFNFRLLCPVYSSQVFQSNTAPQALMYLKLKRKILTLVGAV